MSRLVAAFLVVTLAIPLTATAWLQDGASLRGHWTGIINEPRGNITQYTLSVRIDTDRNGRPVGTVRYDAFPCSGVWGNASQRGPLWVFDETITEGGDRCARHVMVELTPRSDAIDIRLWPVGLENMPSTGRLQKRS